VERLGCLPRSRPLNGATFIPSRVRNPKEAAQCWSPGQGHGVRIVGCQVHQQVAKTTVCPGQQPDFGLVLWRVLGTANEHLIRASAPPSRCLCGRFIGDQGLPDDFASPLSEVRQRPLGGFTYGRCRAGPVLQPEICPGGSGSSARRRQGSRDGSSATRRRRGGSAFDSSPPSWRPR
jgi:hypothetical protein